MGAEENGGGKVGSSPSSSSSSSQRQRFYVELIPGQTTIVSWKKLLREAKEKDQCPPPPSATFMGPSRSGTQHSSSAQETPKRPLLPAKLSSVNILVEVPLTVATKSGG